MDGNLYYYFKIFLVLLLFVCVFLSHGDRALKSWYFCIICSRQLIFSMVYIWRKGYDLISTSGMVTTGMNSNFTSKDLRAILLTVLLSKVIINWASLKWYSFLYVYQHVLALLVGRELFSVYGKNGWRF